MIKQLQIRPRCIKPNCFQVTLTGLFILLTGSFSVFGFGLGETDTIIINKLISKSANYQRKNVDSSYLLALKALELSEAGNYPSGKAKACNQLGAVMMIKGHGDSCLYYCRKALEISRTVHDYKRSSSACVLMNYIYKDRGRNDSALYMIHQALNYSKLANDSVGMGIIYITLGYFFQDYKDYDRALVNHRLAYLYCKNTRNMSGAMDAMMGIANVYYLTKKYEQALVYYLSVDSISKGLNEPNGVAQNQNNIALCYTELNNKPKALVYYTMALETFINQGMRFEEANMYYNLGQMYLHFNDYDSTIFYARKSYNMARDLIDMRKVAMSYQLLALAYAGKGKYAEAYQWQERFTSLNDSLLNIEKVKSISEMQAKYETELKTQEIDVLQKQNEIARIKESRNLGIMVGLGSMLTGILSVRSVIPARPFLVLHLKSQLHHSILKFFQPPVDRLGGNAKDLCDIGRSHAHVILQPIQLAFFFLQPVDGGQQQTDLVGFSDPRGWVGRGRPTDPMRVQRIEVEAIRFR